MLIQFNTSLLKLFNFHFGIQCVVARDLLRSKCFAVATDSCS